MECLQVIHQQITPELRLLAYLSRPFLNATQIAEITSLLPKIDQSIFIPLISQHRVWPCVTANIETHFKEHFSQEALVALKRRTNRCANVSMRQFSTYCQVLNALKAKNIPVVLLKGLPLAKKLFGDISKRYSKDIDLLVHKDHIQQAHKVISGLGYASELYDSISSDLHDVYFKTIKDIAYVGPQGMQIELHLRPCPTESKLSNAIVNAFPQQISEELLFVYLCWHSVSSGIYRLKWLVDIALFFEQLNEHSLERIFECAEDVGEKRVVLLNLVLVHALFGCAIPHYVLARFENSKQLQKMAMRIVRLLSPEVPKSTLENLLESLVIRMTLCGSYDSFAKVTHSYLRPNVRDYMWCSRLPLGLRWGYYILRPVRIFVQHVLPSKIVPQRNV